uniref:Sulfotransferase domain-containing protein n=1 Tax=Anopheles minimus TaxID=112268 RepID=A0A182W219_9DIPT
MTFEFIDIEDPTFQATCRERNEEDYVLVRCNDYASVPINLPNWTPEPVCLSRRYERIGQTIKDMEVRPDDVWIVTYPKSGTTWTQELIWLVCNELNFQQAKDVSIDARFPFIDLSGLRDLPEPFNPLRDALEMPSPRFIKSHLPPAFLPNALWTVQPKLVYVRRNPKSVAVSYYHHSVSLHCYKGTLEQFIRSMINELVYYSPYHKHLIEYSELRYPNMLSLCFEDMKQDLHSAIRQVCKFFNKTYTDDQIEQLATHLGFDHMRQNASVNRRQWIEYNLKQTDRTDKLDDNDMQFIRRGETDGWRTELSTEMIEAIDSWTLKKVPQDSKYAPFTMSSSFAIVDIDTDLSCPGASSFVEIQLNDLTDYPLASTPSPAIVPAKFRNYAQQVRDMQVHEDDVWIVTYPKCGTTWTQEMVWLIDHDLDYETARNVNLNTRSVFLEIGAIADRIPVDTVTATANLKRPRHIKSHLPLALLPRQLWTVNPKIIYVSRNPKDVAVSYLYHYQMIMGYRGTKEAFLNGLLEDRVMFCPQVKHALDFWALKNEQNVLFLTYESMKRDLRNVLPRVCDFFGKAYTDNQLDALTVHLSFDEMKKNPSTNNDQMVRSAMKMNDREGEQFEFMRKGIVGDFRNELSQEYIEKFDKFIEQQLAGMPRWTYTSSCATIMASTSFTFTDVAQESVDPDWNSQNILVQLNDLTDYPLDATLNPPGPMFVSAKYRNYAQHVRDFQVYEDDVWIVTFPKSGTTWTEEMVWLINHGLDYKTARDIKLNTRSTFIEFGAIADRHSINTIDVASNSERPRQIKSHLLLPLLPRQLWTVKPRIIYVARNPKDVAVSYFHHCQVLVGYRGEKEAFFDNMLNDRVTFCPMIPHVLNFWSLKDEPNVLFLTYESMKRDLRGLLPRVCRFLNKSYTDAQLDELAAHLSFSEMKKNPATNKEETVRNALQLNNREGEHFDFMRKGIVGDYRNEMPEEYIKRFDQFEAEQTAGSDFKFDYE